MPEFSTPEPFKPCRVGKTRRARSSLSGLLEQLTATICPGCQAGGLNPPASMPAVSEDRSRGFQASHKALQHKIDRSPKAREHLIFLDGTDAAEAGVELDRAIAAHFRIRGDVTNGPAAFLSERDALLITCPDQVLELSVPPLHALNRFGQQLRPARFDSPRLHDRPCPALRPPFRCPSTPCQSA